MKKLNFILLSSLLSSTTSADIAAQQSTINASTVEAIESKYDDKKVVLEGYIVNQINSEQYIFKDKTGEVKIEIDKKNLNALTVSASTKVRITGQLDKEWNKPIVDVEHVESIGEL